MKELWWTVRVVAAGATALRLSRSAHRADEWAGGRGLIAPGAQVNGRRSLPLPLERMATGRTVTAHVATRALALDRAPRAYDLFEHTPGGRVCVAVRPGLRGAA